MSSCNPTLCAMSMIKNQGPQKQFSCSASPLTPHLSFTPTLQWPQTDLVYSYLMPLLQLFLGRLPSPRMSSLEVFMANGVSSFKGLLKSALHEIHPDHLCQTPAFTFSIIPLLYSPIFCQDTYSFLTYCTIYFLHLLLTMQ